MAKRLFWVKLKNDFYAQPEIKLMMAEDQGGDMVVLYQQLLLMSLEFNGFLRYSEALPYDHRKIAVVTNYKVEFVEKALNLFVELGVVEMLDDGTLYFTKLVDCVGSETEWAGKKREYRSKEDNVPGVSSNCPTDIEKEINSNSEIDSDMENKLDLENKSDLEYSNKSKYCLPLKNGESFTLSATSVDELAKAYPSLDVIREIHKMSAWLKDNPSKLKSKNKINQFINNWLSNEQSKGVQTQSEKFSGTNPNNAQYGNHGEWL